MLMYIFKPAKCLVTIMMILSVCTASASAESKGAVKYLNDGASSRFDFGIIRMELWLYKYLHSNKIDCDYVSADFYPRINKMVIEIELGSRDQNRSQAVQFCDHLINDIRAELPYHILYRLAARMDIQRPGAAGNLVEDFEKMIEIRVGTLYEKGEDIHRLISKGPLRGSEIFYFE